MAERRPARSLRVGTTLLALLGAVALAAPLLATSQPWLVRDTDGFASPALGGRSEAGASIWIPAPIPHDPDAIDLESVLSPPSAGHWMGTDGLGRDVAARIVHGSRVSLLVGLLAALLACSLGAPLGALAGYRGGLVDSAISRIVEGVLCLPPLLLALTLLASSFTGLTGVPEPVRVAVVIAAGAWTVVARYLRAGLLRLKDSEIVLSARAAGAGHTRIVLLHLLPLASAPALVAAAFTVGAAILIESALSFLGMGVHPPTPSWGGILAEARFHVESAWWLALFPGLALFLAVLGCNLAGEGLRDRMDPRGSALR